MCIDCFSIRFKHLSIHRHILSCEQWKMRRHPDCPEIFFFTSEMIWWENMCLKDLRFSKSHDAEGHNHAYMHIDSSIQSPPKLTLMYGYPYSTKGHWPPLSGSQSQAITYPLPPSFSPRIEPDFSVISLKWQAHGMQGGSSLLKGPTPESYYALVPCPYYSPPTSTCPAAYFLESWNREIRAIFLFCNSCFHAMMNEQESPFFPGLTKNLTVGDQHKSLMENWKWLAELRGFELQIVSLSHYLLKF